MNEPALFPLPPEEPNPCVHKFGAGPVGAKCKTCARLIRHDYHHRTYYKCPLRGDTQGAATDHRVGWNACSYYAETE
jgi:hypothetical protein